MGVVERPRRARPASQQLTAYAPVGRSGDFTPGDDKPKEGEPRNWILAGGLGWLYGMGVCVGPFFGVGVGLSFPGGVIAGAGGGVGVVVGIGMSGGLVWGTGRGQVSGFGVPTPMAPPQLPSLAELRRGATTRLEALRTDFGRSGGRRLKATIPRPLGRGGRAEPEPRRRLGLLTQ